MTDEAVREQWRAWARGQSIPAGSLESAVDAALRVVATGAGPHAAAAAARLVGGSVDAGDTALLRRALDRAGVALEEVGGLTPSGALTGEALDVARGIFGVRKEALADVLAGAFRPAAAAGKPARPAPTPPARPAGPTLREFFSEHSILLLSYVGAFLLIVAAVLYEVYAIGELSGGLRFAGVLGLDLVFAAAGWACMRSTSMRLVGSTYVAISALLVPLVAVAGYVFLDLGRRGISVELAVCLTGSALTLLYGAMSVRLRSHAYGYLALVALPFAWLGGIAAAGPGAWQGPAAALLVAAYGLVAIATRRSPGLGDPFSRRAALFVHVGTALTVAVGLLNAAPLSWASVATLAVLGAGYLLATTPGAAHLGLAALGMGWAVAAHELGLGGWTAPAAVLLVPAYSLLGRSRTPVAAAARDLVHPAAAGAVLLGAGLAAADLAAGHRTAWWLPAGLGLLAAAYVVDVALTDRRPALLVSAAAGSMAVLAANAALGLGYDWAAAELLVLAAAYGLAAEVAPDRVLRGGLRAGVAVQALVPVLFVNLPPAVAAIALLASTALLVATAWRTRTPAWLLLAGGAFSVDWYWLGRAVLPPRPPSVGALALLLSPLPVLLGVTGVAVRVALGRAWAWPLYAVAVAAAGAVLSLAGTDAGLTGRALLAYAAVAYAAGAVERSPLAIALAILSGAAGLGLALSAADAAPVGILLALSALAAVAYAAGRTVWRGSNAARDAHVGLGLAGSGAAALAAFTLGGEPLAAVAVLAFAAALVAEARLRPMALLDHAAVLAASLATYFVARYLGATNLQWYVAAPGLALLGVGLALPHDRRVVVAGGIPAALTAAGAALLLGTTAVQAFGDTGWAYTAWLVAEAVLAVLVGIAARSRALVVVGAAAAGVSGLRALFVLVQQGLLFAAFGAAAIFLLGLGAALAALRDRVRGPLGTAWRNWS
jgi:hypothetical protein